MLTSLLFGDIFRHEGQEYVFLAQINERLYAARILSKEDTSKIDKLYQSRVVKNKSPEFEKITLYCYVVLETQEFDNRCAHLHNAGKDIFDLVLEKLNIKLRKIDLRHIKEEITKKKAISIELKELVKDIQI